MAVVGAVTSVIKVTVPQDYAELGAYVVIACRRTFDGPADAGHDAHRGMVALVGLALERDGHVVPNQPCQSALRWSSKPHGGVGNYQD